jgi:hypothetical protein
VWANTWLNHLVPDCSMHAFSLSFNSISLLWLYFIHSFCMSKRL